jgi:double zinc ribbon protein
MDDLDRVFHRLVQNVKARSPEHADGPFTVAELYEQLIPYRHNRRELGIETNQDYEMAVMRLLSGERDYILGDEAMQDALKREVASPNPDTGAFREFATTQISISPAALEKRPERGKTPAAPQPAMNDGPAATAAVQNTARLDQRVEDGSGTAAAARPARVPGFASTATAGEPQGCRYCSGTLPQGRTVTFCPHCGQNLALNQCPACGAEMEKGWKFCIGCGRPNS